MALVVLLRGVNVGGHRTFRPAALPVAPTGIVRFVSVLVRDPIETPALPLQLPPSGQWLVRILLRDGRLVVGEYRRHMKTIGYLGTLDRIFGVPVTTRNWNTMTAIAKALEGEASR